MIDDLYDCNYDDIEDDDDFGNEELEELEEFGCLYGDECVMSYCEHLPSECYTVEIAEEYEREHTLHNTYIGRFYLKMLDVWYFLRWKIRQIIGSFEKHNEELPF